MKTEALPEPCSPINVLESQSAEAAATPLYELAFAHVGEAVGIAPTEKQAAAAVEGMQTPKRLSCIKSTIESFGPREGVDVTVGQPEPIPEGEEGSLIRLLEVDARSKPINVTSIVSFKSGRCVATLLILLQGGNPEKSFVDNLIHRAYGVITDADATCR